MICPTGKAENFSGYGWTDRIKLKGFNKFGFWRNASLDSFSKGASIKYPKLADHRLSKR
jgi:hypothetical protein